MLLFLLACTDPGTPTKDGLVPDDTATADTNTGDTDTTTGEGGCAPLEVEAEVSEDIHTVVRVRWTTASPSSGHVEFGTDDTYGHVTPDTDEGTEHEVLLLGMTADTDVHYKVVGSNSTCDASTEDATITTGSLPAGLYPTRTTGTATSWSGYQVLPLQGTGYAVVVIDPAGHYVWYHQLETDGNLMRAFLSEDGENVVFCLAGPQSDLSTGKIVKVSLDGSTVTETPLPYIDHDMTELPDGTIAAIRVDGREEGTADSIVELAPDGTVTEVFNAWNHWDPAELGVDAHPNWTHGNALDYDPVEDVYYLSMKNLGSMAKIRRSTGEVVWTIDGVLNQFTYTDGAQIQLHHQFEVNGDHILFFENGDTDRGYSRAVEIQYDETNLTAHEVWSYVADPPLFVFAKGDVHRFEDGNTQVVWSSAGEMQNVTPEGDVTWQLDLDLGQAVTFVQIVPSMYASQW